jgi:dihydrodipicolinate synthase/N-acetylneuraminate lyase
VAKNLIEADASAPVIIAFDGRVLSFLCCGVETVMGATGEAWPSQYCVLAKALRERLPKRLEV